MRHSLPLLNRLGLLLFSGTMLWDRLGSPLPHWLALTLLALSCLMMLLGLFFARKEAK